jgi:hypothetical protein
MHKKICRLGTIPGLGSLYVTVKWKEGRLSLTGVEGTKSNGDCKGSCGQCQESPLAVVNFAPGWNRAMACKLADIWARWHLNDMRTGSAAQEAWLRANPVKAVYPESHYEKAGAALAHADLNPDADGYKYGHAWKREEVPADVVAWLLNLPDSDRVHPWGD